MRWRLAPLGLTALLLLALPGGNAPARPESGSDLHQEPILTPARAKTALVELFVKKGGVLPGCPFEIDLSRLADQPLKASERGCYRCYVFHLEPLSRCYSVTLENPWTLYNTTGTFELRDGRWVALPPRKSIRAHK